MIRDSRAANELRIRGRHHAGDLPAARAGVVFFDASGTRPALDVPENRAFLRRAFRAFQLLFSL
jgi:hypothetical protein